MVRKALRTDVPYSANEKHLVSFIPLTQEIQLSHMVKLLEFSHLLLESAMIFNPANKSI
jgi:hypothetical protein